MVAVATDTFAEHPGCSRLGVRTFREQLALPDMAFAADLADFGGAGRRRAVVAVTGNTSRCAEVAFFKKQVRVVTRLVFVHRIRRQLVLSHKLRITMAPAAHCRDVCREHAGLWRFDFENVVHAVAIRADRNFLVVMLEQLLAMLAGFVPGQLIGR